MEISWDHWIVTGKLILEEKRRADARGVAAIFLISVQHSITYRAVIAYTYYI